MKPRFKCENPSCQNLVTRKEGPFCSIRCELQEYFSSPPPPASAHSLVFKRAVKLDFNAGDVTW